MFNDMNDCCPACNKCHTSTAKEYKFFCNECVVASEWVSVGDHFPVEYKPVLLFVPERIHMGEYTYKDEIEIGYCAADRFYIFNNGDYTDGGYGSDYPCKPSHWMQITPPKAESSDE